jgi:hypothetical protein
VGKVMRKLFEVVIVVCWFIAIGPLTSFQRTHASAKPFIILWFVSGPTIALGIIAMRFISGVRRGYSEGMKKLRRQLGECLECGYDLTGNTSCICPECGAACKAASPAGVSPAAGD